jgi:hypothetical protein
MSDLSCAETVAEIPSETPDPYPWRFKKGRSGNPGGQPRHPPEVNFREVVRLARSYAPAALTELARIVREGRSERMRIMAAQELLDRGFGKAKQTVEIEGAPPIVAIERVFIEDGVRSVAPPFLGDERETPALIHYPDEEAA